MGYCQSLIVTCSACFSYAGSSRGVARPSPHGTILLNYEWGEPLTGTGTDEFELCADGLLRVHTHLIVGEDHCKYTQVYKRK